MYRTKRLVYVIEDFSMCGGVERIVSEKASILCSEYGHEVTIISVYKDDRPIRYDLNENVKTVFLNVPMAKKSGNAAIMTFNRIVTLIMAAVRLNRTVKKINPDIIFFATTLSALLLPLCFTEAKKVFESHSAKIFTPYSRLFYFTERCADVVVCLTEDDAKTFRHARNVMVISNFIKRPAACVKDYGRKAAIAVGRLEHVKGFDILIDIWKDIMTKHPDWKLHIYGEGPLQHELQRRIDSYGLEDNVFLCGRCENMIEKYTEYSLHVMTSRYEGQPMTLIEAQACGLPSVVFDFKYGARDIVTDGENGLIVSLGDTKAFIDALSGMMDSDALRRQYGTKAKAVSDRFCRGQIMDMWRQLISEVSARKSGNQRSL